MNRIVFKSLSVEWPTPVSLRVALGEEFNFDHDPCPLGGSEDGCARLLRPWTGKRVFCNPPYGPALRNFLELWSDADLAVYLLPARTDTKWFHEICLPFAKEIRFIKGRLKFGSATNSAPFPSMVVIFESARLQG
jgi:DNA N-6-adenine-methyltransferase (Dam)